VDTDASNVGIGGVLSQVQDKQEHVIAYYSKTMNKAEKLLCHLTRGTRHSEDTKAVECSDQEFSVVERIQETK
jgi:hypothetical protein